MKKFLMIALVAAAFTACSNDNEESNLTNDRQPIILGTSMSGVMRSNSQVLQATELKADETVGVYIYFENKTETTENYGYKNLAYKVVGTVGDLDIVDSNKQPYYPESKAQNVDVYAFHPQFFTTDGELKDQNSVSFTVEDDQSTDANYLKSDFVWGKKTFQPVTTADKREIPMTHMLSKINVNIAAGTGMSLDALKNATITLADVIVDGTVNLTTGVATKGSTAKLLTLTSGTDDANKGTFKSNGSIDCYQASAILYPQTITDKTLTIKLDNGSNYTYTLSNDTFAAGKVNTYDIKINATGLELTTSITPWDDSASATEGNAE